jgi:hypothetical protein
MKGEGRIILQAWIALSSRLPEKRTGRARPRVRLPLPVRAKRRPGTSAY